MTMASPPVPFVLVVVSALVLTCNVLWLYTSLSRNARAQAGAWCGQDLKTWGSGSRNISIGHDYQQVTGNGLTFVPQPIPIPNDTVMLGVDPTPPYPNDEEVERFLTVGISSVWRRDDYLTRSLDSLCRSTSTHEKKQTLVLVLLADADATLRSSRASSLAVRYEREIELGFIRVLQPPADMYPSIDFAAIRRTYNDSVARVQWRTKQVLDFTFLFWYTWSRQPSPYYLVLEDDVLSARHFVSAIHDFVSLHKSHHWIALQLAGFLGIGQLIRCNDLDRLVSFLLLFYREHPVDILINHWVTLMAPEKAPKDRPTRRVPGLFQHIGVHSTLANKTQPLKDNSFSLVQRHFSHVNPPAQVVTTMRQYKAHMPGHAYSSAPGMFWGVPRPGDTFDIILTEPLHVYRVAVFTGAKLTKRKIRDTMVSGRLEVSPLYVTMETPRQASCANFTSLEDFKDGVVDAKHIDAKFPDGVQCIRIVVGPKQKTWVAITEVAVFAKEDIAEEGEATDLDLKGKGNKKDDIAEDNNISSTEKRNSHKEKT
ncbi:alpha-1,6-mannosyl-glycoprotein 4-beta-N-acetylglucosaminyltransferase-like [Oratosquilla oratoria]|uniref:alpha-1,6-mannosyl-glycoprotein 4-beta-N-acetylglucosaminyltransferase-like n=1 Tax=Oratosquilla oratoria TaxID=337810 RepID=UPI003F773045